MYTKRPEEQTMIRRAWRRAFVLVLCAGSMPGLLHGQAKKQSRSECGMGKPAKRLRRRTFRFVLQPSIGTFTGIGSSRRTTAREVKVPNDAKVIVVHATYENSTVYYINCDMAKQKDHDGGELVSGD